MSSDPPHSEPTAAPDPAEEPDTAGSGEDTSAAAGVSEVAPRPTNPPQAPAALGGMGSTGPLTVVPKRG